MKTFISGALCMLFTSTAFSQNCHEVVGYYPNWQWYDRNKLVNPQSIDYSKYTILNYAFMKPEADGSISLFDPWADENLLLGQPDWQNGGYIPNTSLIDNAHSNGVKVLPSIGGWTLSNNFPAIAADPVKRNNFAQACANLITTYGFDGIDLDWEYPGYAPHSGTPQDFQNFTLLLQAVRSALNAIDNNLLLTAAVGASAANMSNVDWPAVSNYLDIINLMSYDFFGTWDATTNHNSPLLAPVQGDPEFNIASSVDRLVNTYMVPADKITVGVPFYGRSAITNGAPGLHVPSTGAADLVTFAADEGTPLYYNIMLAANQFTAYWDATAKVPYMLGNSINTFLSYDNPESIELKAQYIIDEGLRGAIIWEITGDYIETTPGSGVIASTPLVDKINDVFCNYTPGGGTASLDELAQDVQVYPNPTNGLVHLQSKIQPERAEVRDMQGKLMREYPSPLNQLDLGGLSAGSFLLILQFPDGHENYIAIHKL
jgi:GH18 family chitinase